MPWRWAGVVGRGPHSVRYIASATGSGLSGADMTIAVPTGTREGDLMVACHSGTSPPGIPAGWTNLRLGASWASRTIRAQYKWAGPSEPASYTFTSVGSRTGGIATFRGVDSVTPWIDSDQDEVSSPPVILPSQTSTRDLSMLVASVGHINGTGATTYPGSMTPIWDTAVAGTTTNTTLIEPLPTAGATGTRSFGSPGSSMGVVGFILHPA